MYAVGRQFYRLGEKYLEKALIFNFWVRSVIQAKYSIIFIEQFSSKAQIPLKYN